MKDQIRQAVVGRGAIGREGHLPPVAAHPCLRLIAHVAYILSGSGWITLWWPHSYGLPAVTHYSIANKMMQ
jgi:hypothetical protein